MDTDAIRTMVRDAFPLRPPGNFPVIVHRCPECERVEDDFRGRQWDTIAPDVIEWHFDSLPLLSREAFEYLLPAFIVHALNDPDSNVPEFLMYSLDSPRWPRDSWTLNAEQLAAVDAVHSWLQGRHEPQLENSE